MTLSQHLVRRPKFGKGNAIARLLDGTGVFLRYDLGDDLAAAGLALSAPAGRTYFDSNGVLQTVGANVFRDQAYELSELGVWTRVGLLELGSTNGWTYSNDLGLGAWTKRASTLGGTQALAGLTLRKVVEDTTSNTHGIQRTIAGTPSDNTVTSWQFVAAPAERSWIMIMTEGKSTGAVVQQHWFNLTTGQWGDGASAIGTRPRATPLAGGAWRFEVSANVGSGTATPTAYVTGATGDNATAWVGDGTSGFYLGAFQCETDVPVCTSYIPTTTAAVSRAAEVLSFAYPYGMPATGLSVLIDCLDLGSYAMSVRYLQISEAANPRLMVQSPGAAGVQAQFINSAGSASQAFAGAVSAHGRRLTLRGTIAPEGANMRASLGYSVNGGAETVVAGAAIAADPLSGFGTPTGYVNSQGTAAVGRIGLLGVRVARGVKSQAQLLSF